MLWIIIYFSFSLVNIGWLLYRAIRLDDFKEIKVWDIVMIMLCILLGPITTFIWGWIWIEDNANTVVFRRK